MDNDFRVPRIMRLFSKHGGRETARVKPFHNWPEEIRASLVSAAHLSRDESPFLAYYEGPSRWTVLTLQRVVAMYGGHQHAVSISDVKDIALTAEDFKGFSEASIDVPGHAPIDQMTQMHALSLVTFDGTKTRIEFECGHQLIGFWNALGILVRQSGSAG